MRLFRFLVVLTLAIVTFLFVSPSTFDPAVVGARAVAVDTSAVATQASTPLDD